MRPYTILEAPSVLGLKPTGVETLPDALIEAGLASRINARRAGRVEPPAYEARRDSETAFLNAAALAAYSAELADAISARLEAAEFPVVLGGDCSILLGSMLALRRRGRFGLLFVDGHTDFYQPEANINGEAASSDLALVTGRGPRGLTDLEGRSPLLRDEDAFVVGFRDAEEQARYGSQPLPARMRALDLAAVRHLGVDAATREAVAHLSRSELQGFWIHVDADVLDDAVMPAVDYRTPGGLSPDELTRLIRGAVLSGRAAGLEITIYNPKLDPSGNAGRTLTDAVVRALER
jgi:arginase